MTLPRLLLAVLMGLILSGSASAGIGPLAGTLQQLPAPDGCVSETGTGGLCTDGFALEGPDGVAISPDGGNVYAASALSDAIVAFARNPDGSLTELGCISETGTGGLCTDGFALEGAGATAISPDGQNVYVVSLFSDAIVAFARNPDGTLTELGCVSEDGTGGLCADGVALNAPTGVAVSPDSQNVYVTSVISDAVVAFARNPDGTLTELGCVSEDGTGGLCTDGFALDGALGLAVSPDGQHVYAAAVTSDAVVAFARNPDGTLTELGCVSEDGTGGLCTDGFALDGAEAVAVSPGGQNVYVTAAFSDAVVAFARNPDGSLTELGCVSEDGTGGLCTDGFALDLPAGVTASPDGQNVYVASVTSDAVVAFARNPDGTLTELGCVSEDGTGGLCTDGVALDLAVDSGVAIAVSPDGENVYVASTGSDAVAVFARAEADGVGAPPLCDPLVGYCGLPGAAESAPPPLAPGGGGEGGPAVGVNRMPDLSVASLRAWWDGSRLHALLRIRVVKPKLARPFDVELRGADFSRTIRIRPRGRSHVNVDLWLPLEESALNTRVVTRLDPGKNVVEARERNNSASARVRAA